MKRIVVHIPRGGGADPFESLPEHTGHEPFIVLRDRLRDAGYEICVAGKAEIEGSDWVFVFDVHEPDFPATYTSVAKRARGLLCSVFGGRSQVGTFYERCISAGLKGRLLLVAWEPAVVLPANFNPEYHRFFARILTWHDGWVDGKRYRKLHWPQVGALPPVRQVPFADRRLLVNFSGNKHSPHPRELYSARKATIRYFETHHPSQFSLYGPGWDAANEAPFPSWRGTVPHKWDVYPDYRFGLCYENMSGEPGWISEKIFDCMRAGCVPVYLGAPNVADYIEPASFIDRGRFATDAALAQHLSAMTEAEWRRCRETAAAYLRSDRFDPFLPQAFARTVISAIES